MKDVTISYLGITGTGQNKTAAKHNAEAVINRLVQSDFTPVYIQGEKFLAIVFRDIFAYAYVVMHREEGIVVKEKQQTNIGFSDDSRAYIVNQAVNDLAQREWVLSQGDDFSMWEGLSFVSPQTIRNLQEWGRWQVGYKYAVAVMKALPDEAHRTASDFAATLRVDAMLKAIRKAEGGDA